jgi:hypothetical protein
MKKQTRRRFGTTVWIGSVRRAQNAVGCFVPLEQGFVLSVVPAPNKQLERTVIRRHVRAASAPLHYALAARMIRRRAAAQLQR